MKVHFFEHIAFNMKISVVLIISFLTMLKGFFLEHVFSDVDYLIGIGLLVGLDNVSGTFKAIVKKEFDFPTYFRSTITKVTTYTFFIVGIGILLKLKVDRQPANWIQWVDDYLYMGVGLSEFWSIIQNINGINPNLLPEWITKLFKDAAATGRLKPPTES